MGCVPSASVLVLQKNLSFLTLWSNPASGRSGSFVNFQYIFYYSMRSKKKETAWCPFRTFYNPPAQELHSADAAGGRHVPQCKTFSQGAEFYAILKLKITVWRLSYGKKGVRPHYLSATIMLTGFRRRVMPASWMGTFFEKRAGGAELNVASGVALMGLRTGIISRLPQNELGDLSSEKTASASSACRMIFYV